jgi:hypothetical protein
MRNAVAHRACPDHSNCFYVHDDSLRRLIEADCPLAAGKSLPARVGNIGFYTCPGRIAWIAGSGYARRQEFLLALEQ